MQDLLAALDLGTNTVLLLTCRERADGALAEQDELCRVTRLGQDFDATGRLADVAMRRTLAAVEEFAAQAAGGSARGLAVAAATSAVRDARNRDAFLARCAQVLGRPPLVLSGADEALTIFRGATSDRPADAFVVNIDVGGGSTEMSAGFGSNCLHSASLPLGCVRFGERFGLFEVPEPGAADAARGAARELLAPACAEIRGTRPGASAAAVVVSGGAATTYAAMRLGLHDFDRVAVHGCTGRETDVADTVLSLLGMPSAERALLPGITPGRASVLPAGLLILSEALRLLDAAEFGVTTRGLRFGLLLRLRAGEIAPTWTWP